MELFLAKVDVDYVLANPKTTFITIQNARHPINRMLLLLLSSDRNNARLF